jgi:hypothetical protein
MRTDFYTKAMLTIIAACLVYLSLKQAAIMPVAHAAGTTQVIVSGWANSGGVVKPLDVSPLPVHSQ